MKKSQSALRSGWRSCAYVTLASRICTPASSHPHKRVIFPTVVTPYGEIPSNELSRIRDADMRDFMKQVVDRIYTVLLRLDDPEFVERMDNYARRTTAAWDIPNNLVNWFTGR
jgi:hypothetical protein